MRKIIRVSLDESDAETFAKIKAQLGIKADTEVFRHLLTYCGRREGLIPSAIGDS